METIAKLFLLVQIVFALTGPVVTAGTLTPNPAPLPTVNVHPAILQGQMMPYVPQPNFVMLNVPFEPVLKVKNEVQQAIGKQLLGRGEAHITVITPPEYEVIKSFVTIDELHQAAALVFNMQSFEYEVKCLGIGLKPDPNQDLRTFFLVVKSDQLLAYRKEIFDLYLLRGGNPSLFDPKAYWPHITLGFTQRDLHLNDGIYKGENSCIANVLMTTF